MGCLLTACGGTDPTDAALPTVDLFIQPIADAPDPADRAGAAAEYVECTYAISNGGWSRDFGPSGNAADPDGALDQFLGMDLFSLPDDGYVAVGRDTDRLLHTYSVDGTPKVAVIVANSADSNRAWTVETYATCDPAEYDPSTDDELPVDIWLDSEGNRVPTSTVTSYEAQHCGWESVTFLTINDRQYLGDPDGVLSDVVWFDGNATLPADATDTGFQHEGRHLWISADQAVAYLVDGNHVEAWPTPTTGHPIGCA
jgi:hypothetical protein